MHLRRFKGSAIEMPRSDMERGSLRFGTLRVIGIDRLARPRARPRTPRRCLWDQFAPKLIDPKEHGFSEATFRRPLASRAAVVLQLKKGQLMLSRCSALLAAKLQDVSPEVAFAVDDDEGGRHFRASKREQHLA
jgi:hypothetical protein